jgi:acetyl-CoA C-acetyltransferase
MNREATRDVVVVAGVRTAIGSFGGSLKDVPPTELAATVVREVLARGGISPSEVEHVVFGHVINTEPKDMYLSRVAALDGGCSHTVTAFNVNRLCGSGLQAIISASQAIMLGDANVAIAGGAESMSRAPYASLSGRWGARMGDTHLIDMLAGALQDPFDRVHMGVTAENVAQKWDISRIEQDRLALESQHRAQRAIAAGYFKSQIVPVKVKRKGAELQFATDEHVRAEATQDDLARLQPVFRKDGGTVTAGNASGMNDGAASVLLMDARSAHERRLNPMARLVTYAHSGVDPKYMGIGPVKATQLVLQRAGFTLDMLDVIEANEAFAAQACAVSKELGWDPAKVNPNGSGIALGHPIGATGACITVKALHELHRIKGRYALVTRCIGGGQGVAALFERI